MCHLSSISRILKQPFQESIANSISRIRFGFLAVFSQNLISIVNDNTTAFTQMLKHLYTRNYASRRNI